MVLWPHLLAHLEPLEGDVMTFIFTTLLCLGLSLGQETPMLPEKLPKATIKAHPGSVVTRGIQMTIECEGNTRSQEYRLYKEGGPRPWRTKTISEPRSKANFTIPSVEEHHAGRYRCYYQTPAGWSEESDTLELLVTGSETISPSQNISETKTALKPQNHTVENLIRMSMAGLIFIVLGFLLFEAHYSQRRT